jgi:hypothetical protein
MPNQVDGALVRAPCPVPSYPACEPNSGSILPSLSTKATGVEGPTLLCNQVPYQNLTCLLTVFPSHLSKNTTSISNG